MCVYVAILCPMGLCAAFVYTCMAQTSQNGLAPIPRMMVRSQWFSTGPVQGLAFQPVTGAPYSAEETTEHVQTLLDGTRITQTNMEAKLYRDAAGRTRVERTLLPNGQAAAVVMPSFVEIADPVAGYRYTLDERSHTARRMVWSVPKFSAPTGNIARVPVANRLSTGPVIETGAASATIAAAPSAAVNPSGQSQSHPVVKHEALGTQNIEGVQATGTRTTITYPEGSFGNDRPVTTSSESWTSPELKLLVLSMSSDPRYGDTTTRVTNVVRAEPDPSLFEIPADYTVVDQPAGGISLNRAGNQTAKR